MHLNLDNDNDIISIIKNSENSILCSYNSNNEHIIINIEKNHFLNVQTFQNNGFTRYNIFTLENNSLIKEEIYE